MSTEREEYLAKSKELYEKARDFCDQILDDPEIPLKQKVPLVRVLLGQRDMDTRGGGGKGDAGDGIEAGISKVSAALRAAAEAQLAGVGLGSGEAEDAGEAQ